MSSFGNISELVLSKFDNLSPDQQRFAEHCAVLGGSFEEKDLLLMGWAQQEVEELVCDLEIEGILEEEEMGVVGGGERGEEEEEEGEYRWRWKQQLWQSSVYEKMLSPARMALHEKVAEALGESTEIETLAKQHYHWVKAQRAKEACESGLLVGDWYSKRGQVPIPRYHPPQHPLTQHYRLLKSTLDVLTKSLSLGGDGFATTRIMVVVEQAKTYATLAQKKACAMR
jgi:predicted hotdog family 3-hydroxylacyl-ACP dehydratase